MSDNLWSFYEFSQLMTEAKKVVVKNMPQTTTGRTEAKPKVTEPTRRVSGRDPLEQAPRTKETVGKLSRKPVEKMDDREAASKIMAELKSRKSIADALMTYNDVNKNWATGYWLMLKTLEELGYEVPDISNDEDPRWVLKAGPDGQIAPYPHNPDGPYVTVNTNRPYSVQVNDRMHVKNLLKKVAEITKSGGDIESEETPDKKAWLAALRGKGGEIEQSAEEEGDATQRHDKSVFMQMKPSRSKVLDINKMREPKTGEVPQQKTKRPVQKLDKLMGAPVKHEWSEQVDEWIEYTDILENIYM